MAQTEVLREFLVSIGYREDEPSRRRFNENLDRTGKNVSRLGLALTAMVTGAAVATAKTAKTFEGLYWMSRRTHESVGNIKAFEFAMRQMGGSADDARSAIEGVSSFVRNNPGAKSFFSANFGINTTGKGPLAVIREVLPLLKSMPPYLGKAFAEAMGLSEAQLLMLKTGRLEEHLETQARFYREAGVDADKAAAESEKFQRQVDELGGRLVALKDRLFTDLLYPLTPELEKLNKMFGGSADGISNFFRAMASGVEGVTDAVRNLKRASEESGLTELVSRTGEAFFNRAKLELQDIWDLADRPQNEREKTALYKGFGVLISDANPGIGGGLVRGMAALGNDEAQGIVANEQLQNRINRAMDFFTGVGWSKNQAAGIVANLVNESGLKTGATGDDGDSVGIAQWNGSRRAKFKELTGKDLQNSSMADQLWFVQWELRNTESTAFKALLQATSAGKAERIFGELYERPNAGLLNARLGKGMADQIAGSYLTGDPLGLRSGGTNITAETNINVHTSDPVLAGQTAASENGRALKEVVRNGPGAIR